MVHDYAVDPVRVERRQRAYQSLWGRAPDLIFHQSDIESPHIDVLRFPPTWRFWAPARDVTVYVTGGMGDLPQPNAPPDLRRVELTSFVGADGDASERVQDPVAKLLHNLAHEPFRRGYFFGPLHTLDMGRPLSEGSEMTGFFFGVTPSVGQKRACRAAQGADAFLQAVPISSAELGLAKRDGPEALLNRFETAGVPPYFDLRRRSVV